MVDVVVGEYTTLPLLSTPEALDVSCFPKLAVGYKSNKLFAPITSHTFSEIVSNGQVSYYFGV
jgi:hypothetical protein